MMYLHAYIHTRQHLQASLNLDQSIVSLLERADLDASDDLAFDYIMSITDFAFTVSLVRTRLRFSTSPGSCVPTLRG